MNNKSKKIIRTQQQYIKNINTLSIKKKLPNNNNNLSSIIQSHKNIKHKSNSSNNKSLLIKPKLIINNKSKQKSNNNNKSLQKLKKIEIQPPKRSSSKNLPKNKSVIISYKTPPTTSIFIQEQLIKTQVHELLFQPINKQQDFKYEQKPNKFTLSYYLEKQNLFKNIDFDAFQYYTFGDLNQLKQIPNMLILEKLVTQKILHYSHLEVRSSALNINTQFWTVLFKAIKQTKIKKLSIRLQTIAHYDLLSKHYPDFCLTAIVHISFPFLLELKLQGFIPYHLQSLNHVYLPNLKSLQLSQLSLSQNFKFLSKCALPLLETLIIRLSNSRYSHQSQFLIKYEQFIPRIYLQKLTNFKIYYAYNQKYLFHYNKNYEFFNKNRKSSKVNQNSNMKKNSIKSTKQQTEIKQQWLDYQYYYGNMYNTDLKHPRILQRDHKIFAKYNYKHLGRKSFCNNKQKNNKINFFNKNNNNNKPHHNTPFPNTHQQQQPQPLNYQPPSTFQIVNHSKTLHYLSSPQHQQHDSIQITYILPNTHNNFFQLQQQYQRSIYGLEPYLTKTIIQD